MGPLVPDIITNELNLVVAFLIGIGFGYILEQAGFSSSRKLTGLFYGTDFTVLRVFFTAGATAMTVILLLAKAGWLDTSIIFVNPTFIQSALVGGAIMGVGFVVGGYCPGTSFCGAAVGRIDGLVFVIGGLVGVLGFGLVFPKIEWLYTAGSMGDLTLPMLLGTSPGAVTIGTIVIAVAAFAATGRIQRIVNPRSMPSPADTWRHRYAGVAFVLVGLTVAAVPSARERLQARVSDPAFETTKPVSRVSPDELAFRVVDQDRTIQIVDVRSPEVFAKAGLPGAVNIQRDELFTPSTLRSISGTRRHTVFVGDDERAGVEAALLARELGIQQVAVLAGGFSLFAKTVLNVQPPLDAFTGADRDTWSFRVEASPVLAKMIRERGAAKVAPKAAKKIAGGCGI